MEEIRAVPPAPPKKPNLLTRFLAFLLTMALVVGAVAVVAYRDKFNFDSIKRYFTYRSLERNDSGQAESFSFEHNNKNSFAPLDGGLLVCSPNNIRLYSGNGTVYIDKTVSLDHPVVDTSAKGALVYDAGGQSLYVFSNYENVFSLTLGDNSSLLSARMNDAGWLAVTTQETGYKGSVTIYNAAYEPVLKINLSSSFVIDAVLSPDSKTVAVSTVGLNGGSFESRINLYSLYRDETDTEPDFVRPVGNNVSLDLRWYSDGIWTLGENSLSRVQADGTLAGSYQYTGRYLKNFSLAGDGYAALLLGKYRAGSSADLTIIDGEGTVLASLPLNEQVLSLSAAGRYISVLTADKLEIYTRDLELYDRLEVTQGAQRVIQRSDGSVMLISLESARLYLPS